MGEESTRFWWESLKERVHVEDCKWEDGIRMKIVLEGGPVVGCCECDEPLGYGATVRVTGS
jgi:hypothetical protein